MDGTVTALNVEVGENVLTGTMNNPGTVILTLSDLASMEVLADVDETDVVNVAAGQPARVLVDAIPDTSFEGVGDAGGAVGARTDGPVAGGDELRGRRSVERARPLTLRPGMNADVEIRTGLLDSTLAVPLQALTARPPNVVERWKAKRAGKKLDRRRHDRARGAQSRRGRLPATTEERRSSFPSPWGCGAKPTSRSTAISRRGPKLITGPYRTLRKLSDQEAIRPEKSSGGKAKKSRTRGDETKAGLADESPGTF